MISLAEHFSLVKEGVLHPVNYKTITQYQQNDKPLIESAKSYKDYLIKHCHGKDKKYSLVYRKNKKCDSQITRKQVIEWYHNAICHPGETRPELSIAQHFSWRHLRKTIHAVCSKCKAYQFLKRNRKQCGKFPPK